MQKTITFLVTMFFSTTILAQINKGAHWWGGSVSYKSYVTKSELNNQKNNNFYFNPAYGRAIKENQILGAELELGYGRSKFDNGTTQFTNSKDLVTGIGVFKRWYQPFGKNFYLFGQLRTGVAFRDRTVTSISAQNEKNKNHTLSGSIVFHPGVSYALSKKIHLESGFNNLAYLQFSSTKTTNLLNGQQVGDKLIQNNFEAGSNFPNQSLFYLGVRVLMNPSK